MEEDTGDDFVQQQKKLAQISPAWLVLSFSYKLTKPQL